MKNTKRRLALALILCLVIVLTSCEAAFVGDNGSYEEGQDRTTESTSPMLETWEEACFDEPKETDPAEDTEEETSHEWIEATAVFTEGYFENLTGTYIEMIVENIMQNEIQMMNGCEVVSLSIALKYYGYEIDPRDLFDDYMPKGPNNGKTNPFEKYMGDPSNRTGYGCYAPCVVTTANKYLKDQGAALVAHDISGSTMTQLEYYLAKGYPIVLWATLNMEDSAVIGTWEFDGEPVSWYAKSHCVVLAGYDYEDFIICDPQKGVVYHDKAIVEKAYNLIYSQAVVILPEEPDQ